MVTGTESRPRRPLYVSAVVGGNSSANARVDAGISTLARLVREQEEALPAPEDPSTEAAVDVTFHVPGPLLSPDYEGIRTGRWVKAKQLLVVQVAVPEGLSDEEGVKAFLGSSLVEAVSIAEQYLAKKKLDLMLDRPRLIAERAAAALS